MLPHRAFLGVTGPGMGLGTGETPGQRPGQPSDRRSNPPLNLSRDPIPVPSVLRWQAYLTWLEH